MGILYEVKESHCIPLLANGLDECGSFPIIFPRELSLVQTVFSSCHALSHTQYVPVVLSVGKYAKGVEFNGRSPTSAFAENAWRDISTSQ